MWIYLGGGGEMSEMWKEDNNIFQSRWVSTASGSMERWQATGVPRQEALQIQRSLSALVEWHYNTVQRHIRHRRKWDHTTAAIAMLMECAELVNQLDWKPWRSTPENEEKIYEEVTDVIFFLLAFLIAKKLDMKKLADTMLKKAEIVLKRNAREEDG